MKEGVEIKIPLRGINRSETRTSGTNGNLDEFINLRWKDNAWRPTPLLKPIIGLDVANYGYIYIHTNDYHHVLGSRGNTLYWFGNIIYNDDNKASGETFEIPKKVCDISGLKDIKQTGNLISIIDDNGISYILFDEFKQTYISFDLDYNGAKNATSLLPDGLIDLKVEAIHKTVGEVKYPLRSWQDENLDTEGLIGLMLIDDLGRYEYSEGHKKLMERTSPTIEKAFALAKEKNLFSEGYFLACTALELYDGNYILMSRPVLMSPPHEYRELQYTHKQGNKTYNVDEGNGTGHFIHNYDKRGANMQDLNFADNYTYSGYCLDNVKIYDYEATNGKIKDIVYSLNNVNNIKRLSAFASIGEKNARTSCTLTHNQLKIRFNKDSNSNLKDIIKNVCVFVTREIRDIDLTDPSFSMFKKMEKYTNSNYEFTGTMFGGQVIEKTAYELILKKRKASDILKDIEDLTTFYKISSYSYKSIKKGVWQTVNIEDGVLSTLTEQDRLTIEAFDRDKYNPSTSLMYNGKLHIANYTQEYFRGFPLNYFYAFESYGQYPVGMADLSTDSLFEFGFVEVTIESQGTISKVYRTIDASVSNKKIPFLAPILSYPSSSAKTMRIVLRKSNGSVYDNTFNLTQHQFFDMAYYINPEFKPIDITPNQGTSITLQPKEYNNIIKHRNGLKVSATDNPLYFPASSTYQIGNGTILGLSTNEVAVSTGQQGDAPLYVFCTDGIYGLFVDASGTMTYPNSRPLSRDICNNPYSITPVDGGIIFSTDTGLMMISGVNTKLLSEQLDGDPFYFSQNGYDYNKDMTSCFSSYKIADLKKYITKEHIRTYLRNAVIGYNYFDKELFVCNKLMPYTYVCSNGAWHKRNKTYINTINAYPRLFLNDGKNLYDTYPDNDITGYEKVAFLTRPYQYSEESFKQNLRTILRGQFKVDKVGSYNDFVINIDDIDDTPKYELVELKNENIKRLTINTNSYDCQDIYLQEEDNIFIEVRDEHITQSITINQSVKLMSNLHIDSSAIIQPTEDNLYLTATLIGELGIINYSDKLLELPPATPALQNYVGFLECYVWVGYGDFNPLLYTEEELLSNANVRKVKFSFVCNQGDTYATYQPLRMAVLDTSYNNAVVVNALPKTYDIYVQLNNDTMVNCTYYSLLGDCEETIDFYSRNKELKAQDDIYAMIEPTLALPEVPYYIPTDSITLYFGLNITLSYQGNVYEFTYNGVNGNMPIAILLSNINYYPIIDNKNVSDIDIYISNKYLKVNTPSGIYNVEWTGNVPSLVNGRELYSNIINNSYPQLNKINNHNNEFGNGNKVIVTIDGIENNIIYKGGTHITDEELYHNIKDDIYDTFTLLNTASEVNIIKGVNYKFIICLDGETTEERTLTAKVTNVVTIKDILDKNTAFFDDTDTYNSKLNVCIPAESSFSITYQNELYEGVTIDGCNSLGELIDMLLSGKYDKKNEEESVCGLYLFGSYDCKRWGLLGAKENIGDFKDIGLLAHRCDVKYFRLLFVGQISRESYIEYIDTINSNKIMNRKIR